MPPTESEGRDERQSALTDSADVTALLADADQQALSAVRAAYVAHAFGRLLCLLPHYFILPDTPGNRISHSPVTLTKMGR